MSGPATDLGTRCIDTIRTLCIDAIESARSGGVAAPLEQLVGKLGFIRDAVREAAREVAAR